MENMVYVDQFTDYLLERENSEKTIESYVSDIKQFIIYFYKNIPFDDMGLITNVELRKYTAYLKNVKNEEGEPLAIKTINRKLVSLNQFIEFLNYKLNMKIAMRTKQLKISSQNFIDDMLDLNDVRRIINAAEKENDIRAKTLFYTLLLTGARVSEILQIKVTDIDKNTITVKGKGSKYRDLLIPKRLLDQWKIYSSVRSTSTDYLFSGERGAINRQTVHNTIKYYTGKARGIDKSTAHAHSFRHLYAQNLAQRGGVNSVIISQLLGHSLGITGSYIQQSKKELLKIINRLDIEEAPIKKSKKTK